MEVTLDLLLYCVRDLNPVILKRPAHNRLYQGVHYLTPEKSDVPETSNYLFIASVSELRAIAGYTTDKMTVLVSSDSKYTKKELLTLPCGIILVNGKFPVPYLINRMIRAFQSLTEWDKNMHIAALEGKSLQQLVDLSEQMIAHPVIVFDAAFDVLAYSRNISTKYANFGGTTESGYTNAETMRLIKENHILSRLKKETPLLVAPAVEDKSITTVYLSFYGDDNLIGYACIFLEEKIERGYLDLVKLFTTNLTFALKREFDHQRFGQMLYETLLLNLLANPGLPEEQLSEQIRNVEGLRMHGRFLLGVMDFHDPQNVPLKFLAKQIDHMLPDCKPFIYEDHICLLRTLQKGEPCKDWSDLELLAGKDNYTCGISNEFLKINHLQYAWHQAQAALKFKIRGDQTLIHYAEICGYDLLETIEQTMPVELLQMGLYRQLSEYDSTHGTSYKQIILEYIKCDCNATHAAQKLYLHRNTVRNVVQFTEEKWAVKINAIETKKLLLLGETTEKFLQLRPQECR